MADPASSFPLTSELFDAFDGASLVGVPISATGQTFQFARYFYVPRDTLYFLRVWTYGYDCVVRHGVDEASMQVVMTPRESSVAEVFVLFKKGINRIDLQTISFVPEIFTMILQVPGRIDYFSDAAGWVYEIATDVLDAEIPAVSVQNMPVFTILPDWSESITERLEFLTEVNPSESAAEGTRRVLRYRPRRTFEAQFLRQKEDRMLMDSFFAGVRGAEFYLPLWHDQHRTVVAMPIGATSLTIPLDPYERSLQFREFRVGDTVLVINSDPRDYEILRVASLDFNNSIIGWESGPTREWPVGTKVIPCRLARILEQVEMAGPTDTVFIGRARFTLTEPEFRFGAGAGDYWFFRINRAEDMTYTYDSARFVNDLPVGPVEVTEVGTRSLLSIRASLAFFNRGELIDFRRFIAGCAGRAYSFLFPTRMDDISLAGDSITGFYFDANPTGYYELIRDVQPARGYVVLYLRDGFGAQSHRITQVTREAGLDRFYVNEALPDTLVSNVFRVSYVVPMRFDQDTFEFEHRLDEAALVTTSVVLRSAELVSGIG